MLRPNLVSCREARLALNESRIRLYHEKQTTPPPPHAPHKYRALDEHNEGTLLITYRVWTSRTCGVWRGLHGRAARIYASLLVRPPVATVGGERPGRRPYNTQNTRAHFFTLSYFFFRLSACALAALGPGAETAAAAGSFVS
jgi:hypothetical protein